MRVVAPVLLVFAFFLVSGSLVWERAGEFSSGDVEAVSNPVLVTRMADEIGMRVPVLVTLRNTSHKDVIAIGVSSSCGCLAQATAFPVTIPANGETKLSFVVDFDSDMIGDVFATATVFLQGRNDGPIIQFVGVDSNQ